MAVKNVFTELILKSNHKLHGIQTVKSKVFCEVGIERDLFI